MISSFGLGQNKFNNATSKINLTELNLCLYKSVCYADARSLAIGHDARHEKVIYVNVRRGMRKLLIDVYSFQT